MALCLRIFLGMVPSLEGLTRTMTSDLPVRLGSCVLLVLRGKGHTPQWVLPLGVKSLHPYGLS